MKPEKEKSEPVIRVPNGTKRILLDGNNKLIGVTVQRGKKRIHIFYGESL